MDHNVPFATMQDMRADAQEKRDAIISASRRLFAQEGFDVPFRTIASAADVGVATVHRHFPDRLGLIQAVATAFWNEMELIIHKYDNAWEVNAEETFYSILCELGALHPLSFAAIGADIIREHNVELDETNPVFVRGISAISELVNTAKEHDLLADDIAPLRFYIGFAIITREAPGLAEKAMPDYMEWLIQTYLRGLRP